MPKTLEEIQKEIEKTKHPDDYHHPFEVRASSIDSSQGNGNLDVEGTPVVFGQKTHLFDLYDGTKVYEVIDKHAFDECDSSDAFFRYNHSDEQFPLARTRIKDIAKEGSLVLSIAEDGLHMRANLMKTTAGEDCYRCIKAGTLSEMSFAFSTEGGETIYDNSVEGEVTITRRKISRLFDVAAVMRPAYGNTEIHARAMGDVETFLSELESEKRAKELRMAKIRAGVQIPKTDKSK